MASPIGGSSRLARLQEDKTGLESRTLSQGRKRPDVKGAGEQMAMQLLIQKTRSEDHVQKKKDQKKRRRRREGEARPLFQARNKGGRTWPEECLRVPLIAKALDEAIVASCQDDIDRLAVEREKRETFDRQLQTRSASPVKSSSSVAGQSFTVAGKSYTVANKSEAEKANKSEADTKLRDQKTLSFGGEKVVPIPAKPAKPEDEPKKKKKGWFGGGMFGR